MPRAHIFWAVAGGGVIGTLAAGHWKAAGMMAFVALASAALARP
jgi:hypothetical protein